MKRKKLPSKKPHSNYNPNASEYDYPAQILNFKKHLVTKALKKMQGQ
jgi:hypothetical protein